MAKTAATTKSHKKAPAKKDLPAKNKPPEKVMQHKQKLEDCLNNYSFSGNLSHVKASTSAHKTVLHCRIDGTPRPLERTFAKANNNTAAGGRKINVFNSSESKNYCQSFKSALTKALDHLPNKNPFTNVLHQPEDADKRNPVKVKVEFYFPRPKKHFIYDLATKKLVYNKRAPVYVTKTPDLDNCIKLLLDCCQEILYSNDRVVVEIVARQLWSRGETTYNANDKGCTVIHITEFQAGTVAAPGEYCDCMMCKYLVAK